jgi:hypothetical protein
LLLAFFDDGGLESPLAPPALVHQSTQLDHDTFEILVTLEDGLYEVMTEGYPEQIRETRRARVPKFTKWALLRKLRVSNAVAVLHDAKADNGVYSPTRDFCYVDFSYDLARLRSAYVDKLLSSEDSIDHREADTRAALATGAYLLLPEQWAVLGLWARPAILQANQAKQLWKLIAKTSQGHIGALPIRQTTKSRRKTKRAVPTPRRPHANLERLEAEVERFKKEQR